MKHDFEALNSINNDAEYEHRMTQMLQEGLCTKRCISFHEEWRKRDFILGACRLSNEKLPLQFHEYLRTISMGTL
jgi:hypothetical protein